MKYLPWFLICFCLSTCDQVKAGTEFHGPIDKRTQSDICYIKLSLKFDLDTEAKRKAAKTLCEENA